MTRIIMVRHGQSQANEKDLIVGHSDFDLTELGIEQARLAAEYLFEREKLSCIYSSDLKRAHNTALPFAKKYGLPINETASLRELYAGKWEAMKFTDVIKCYPKDMLIWRDDFSNARCTDGESVRELYLRVVNAVCDIARQNPDGCVLITSHATPVRAVECFARGLGVERINEVRFVKNAAISIFEFDPTDGSMSVVKTDITEHLESEQITALPNALEPSR